MSTNTRHILENAAEHAITFREGIDGRIPSPTANDYVMDKMKLLIGTAKKKHQKLLLQIYMRDLHDDLMKEEYFCDFMHRHNKKAFGTCIIVHCFLQHGSG